MTPPRVDRWIEIDGPNADTNCTHCQGTGWRRTDNMVYVEDEFDNYKVKPCSCDGAAIEERYRATIMGAVGVPKTLQDAKLEDCPAGPERMKAELWADSYPDVNKGLMFLGGRNTGKTALAAGILRRIHVERLKRQCRSRWIYPPRFLRSIQATWSRDPEDDATEQSIFDSILRCDIVVLHELGDGLLNREWASERLTELLLELHEEGGRVIVTGDRAKLLQRLPEHGVQALKSMCHVVYMGGEP